MNNKHRITLPAAKRRNPVARSLMQHRGSSHNGRGDAREQRQQDLAHHQMQLNDDDLALEQQHAR